MRNKAILIVVSLGLFLGVTVVYFKSSVSSSAKIAARTIEKNGIYVGDRQPGLEPTSEEASGFERTVKGLNEGWESIRLGNSYDNAGRYEEAVQAYKKAYEVDPGNRILAGRLVIETYEKMGRYDDALSVVNEILKTQPLGEYGVEKYTAIRARLLTAKQNQSQTSSP